MTLGINWGQDVNFPGVKFQLNSGQVYNRVSHFVLYLKTSKDLTKSICDKLTLGTVKIGFLTPPPPPPLPHFAVCIDICNARGYTVVIYTSNQILLVHCEQHKTKLLLTAETKFSMIFFPTTMLGL